MITLEKSKCDKYVLRSKDQHWWAVFMISEDGFVSIQSDYGDYNYCWSSRGDQTIKEFLIDCNDDYLMGKLGMNLPKEFNGGKTAQRIKEDILRERKQRYIESNLARFYFDLCKEIKYLYTIQDFEDYINSEHFSGLPSKALENLSLLDFYEKDYSSIPVIMDKPQQLKAFFEHIWPPFIEILKEEIGAENGKPN